VPCGLGEGRGAWGGLDVVEDCPELGLELALGVLGHFGGMSVVPHPDEPTALTVLPPEEALKHARPLPGDDEMAIDGLTDGEWEAFEKALAAR
jgi:hypothetical protein